MVNLGSDDSAGTQLTLLGSVEDIVESRLVECYAYPAHTPEQGSQCWVRANFIASLDGGATVENTSGGLAGPGDRALFKLMRELADVILVGAGTVRAENYSGVHLSVRERQDRGSRGQTEVPPIAIVTESGQLNRDLSVFTDTEVPPIIFTTTASAAPARQHLGELAEVVDASGPEPTHVDAAVVLKTLAARDLRNVLTEGGPSLLSTLIERDLLDELCLTVAPVLVGGQARRIATGPGQILTRMRCQHMLRDEAGYLYTRYVRG